MFEYFCQDTAYSEAVVCRYIEQLLSGLAYLHAKHIIHLDLKPENLILDAKQQTLHLIDFGSAQVLQPLRNCQSQGECTSSIEFQAPEVISSGPVATYTDMWGVGVLLYVCLR